MKKLTVITLIFASLTTVFTGCSQKANSTLYQETTVKMDTNINLRAFGSNAKPAVEESMKRLDEIEKMASTDLEGSDVWKINNSAGKEYVKVHPEIIKMLQASQRYSKLSGGAWDVTVGPLIKLWHIGTGEEVVPSDAEIKTLLPLVGYDKLSINEGESSVKLQKPGMSIDLGGIAKGFAADEVMKIYKKYNIENGLIDLGGSTIFAIGKNVTKASPWSIGIQHPRLQRGEDYLGIIKISNEALSTSGDYERYFIKDGKRYHHILNPATGYPASNGVISDTIVIKGDVEDANMQADMLTTTVFVSGVDKGMQIIESMPGIECAITTEDKKIYTSSGFKKRLEGLNSDFTEIEMNK